MPQSYNHNVNGWTRIYDSRDGFLNWEFKTQSMDSRTFTGSTTPNYKAFQKANGYLPTLACQSTKVRAVANAISYTEVYQFYYRIYNIQEVGSFSIPTWDVKANSLVDEAWSKLRQKVQDKDFDAGVFVAEFGQSRRLLTSTATRVYNAVRAMRRGRLQEVITHLGIVKPKRQHRPGSKFSPIPKGREDDLHNRWLEFQYGWKPLVSDAFSAAKAAAKLSVGRKSYRRIRASSQDTFSYTEGTLTGTCQLKADVWCIVQTRNPNLALLDSLGLMNPVALAWELVPYSFVFDWFVNVGDFLTEATAFSNVQVLDGGFGKTVNFSGRSSYEKFPGIYTDADVTTNWYQRTPGVQYMPTLRINKSVGKFTQALTSLALIRQKAKNI